MWPYFLLVVPLILVRGMCISAEVDPDVMAEHIYF